MTTAFVLSGGGSLGAVQVGMLQALDAHDIHPDLLVGTSAGALNAAWVAHHGMSADSLARLAALWGQLRRRDVFPVSLSQVLHGLLGRSPGVFSSANLGEMVRAHAGIEDLSQASIPVHLVAADLLSGEEVLISSGSVSAAVRASAAIPGVFPPAFVGGRWLIDGAVAGHSGVAQALDLGASMIYVLPTGFPCALPHPPRSAIGVAMHALTLLIEQRLVAEVADLSHRATIRVLPPLCPLKVSASDFSHAAELVRRGRRTSTTWLVGGGVDLPGQERFLSLHDHDSNNAVAAFRDRAYGR